jgi:hypothetical protein
MGVRIGPRRRDSAERALRVEAGEVVCPRQGVADIEDCWVCPSYRGLSEGRSAWVICGLSEDTLAGEAWALDQAGSAP